MKLLTSALVTVLTVAASSQAGIIYHDRPAYEAAVEDLLLTWSEDFEGFPLGEAPLPTPIGGGAAEIDADGGTAAIIVGPLTGQSWVGLPGGFGETIQGPAGGSLLLDAIAFDYFSQFEGGYDFHHSGGVDSDDVMPDLEPLFVGWVGGAGEVLDFVDYTPGDSSHVLDNFVAHVPEPSTFVSASLGALVLGYRRRR